MNQPIWSGKVSFKEEDKRNLVIMCSDWRFREPSQQFLKEHLGLIGYDLIAVPGAMHFLVSMLLPKFMWVGRRWLKFFFDHHHTTRLIVLSHGDCGWYKFLYAVEQFTPALRVAQEVDGKRARNEVHGLEKDIVFEHYVIDSAGDDVTAHVAS